MASSYPKPGQMRASTTTKGLLLEFGTVRYRNTAAWMRAEFKSCVSHTVLGEEPPVVLGRVRQCPLDCGRGHGWNYLKAGGRGWALLLGSNGIRIQEFSWWGHPW